MKAKAVGVWRRAAEGKNTKIDGDKCMCESDRREAMRAEAIAVEK